MGHIVGRHGVSDVKHFFSFMLATCYARRKAVPRTPSRRTYHLSKPMNAGHSHWNNIMHHKGKKDLAKSKAFSKLSQEIRTAVKTGRSGNPKENSRLELALEKAKALNFPRDKVEEAIANVCGDMYRMILTCTGPWKRKYSIHGLHTSPLWPQARCYSCSCTAYCVFVRIFTIQGQTDNKNRTTLEFKRLFKELPEGVTSTLEDVSTFRTLFEKRPSVDVKIVGDASEDVLTQAAMECGAKDLVYDPPTAQVGCQYHLLNSLSPVYMRTRH